MTQALNLALLANNVNTSGQLNGATGLYGTIPVSNLPTVTPAYGGTGTTATPTNGQIHIGNGSGFTLATLTAGTGMSITNGAGSITLNSSSLPGVLGQVFTSNGTFTIPSGVTALKVTVLAGGGTGAAYTTTCSAGGSGGAGGAAISYLTGLTPGNTLSVTVGAAGGASSVASGTQTITTISATGGGNGVSGGAPGTGGSGSGGTLNFGGASGSSGGGENGAAGANSIFGGGAAAVYNTGGQAARAYGAGGSGTGHVSSSSGAGYQGVVIFEW